MHNDKQAQHAAGWTEEQANPANAAGITSDAHDAKRTARRRRFAVFFGVVALAGVAWLTYWGLSARFFEETDDAYVAGNIVQIAAQI
ncbi:MAG: hypothetical protein ACN6OQ_22220, partial [Paraburkholderia nemoris]